MDLRIIKNASDLKGDILSNGLVLEKLSSPSEYNNIELLKMNLYNLETNTKEEILPKVKKYDIAQISNLYTESEYVYLTTAMPLLNGKSEINILRFNINTNESERVCTYTDELTQYNSYKKLQLYVINDLYIIFQYSLLRSNYSDTYEGYLDFELYLYSIKDEKRIEIQDENLRSNGIAAILPINDTACVIKTGFSLLEDMRYKYLEKTETTVEGISIINPLQLVSDILLMKKNIVFDTMDQTYFNMTIPYIKKEQDYIIYSRVNLENHEEEVIFFDYTAKKAYCCIARNVFEEKDLAKFNVINNTPYIRLEGKQGTELYNLKKKSTDVKFDINEKVVDVANDLIITTMTKKSIFTGEQSFIKVYKYPQINLLHREKGSYRGCFSSGKDRIYILTENE